MTAPLPTKVKRFIVQLLAQGDSVSEVVRAVASEFSLDVSKQAVMRYNPTRVQGGRLSPALKELFYSTRKAFIESADDLPMAQKAIRLNRLEVIHEQASEAGNLKSATQAIEAARREMVALDLSEGEGITGVFRVINSPDLDVPATPNSGNQLPDSDALQHEAEPPAVAE